VETAADLNKQLQRGYRHKDCLIGLLKSERDSTKQVIKSRICKKKEVKTLFFKTSIQV
jgi:hypothetical protein